MLYEVEISDCVMFYVPKLNRLEKGTFSDGNGRRIVDARIRAGRYVVLGWHFINYGIVLAKAEDVESAKRCIAKDQKISPLAVAV